MDIAKLGSFICNRCRGPTWRLWAANCGRKSIPDRVCESDRSRRRVPFILEEFLRSADATNATSEQSLPQSVESVIHARLQRLSPKLKTFVQTLSLLGQEIEIQLATTVLGVDVGELLNALFELDPFAFIHPLAGNSVRFRHQIIAEACANTIPRDQRRETHQAAVQAIIRRYPIWMVVTNSWPSMRRKPEMLMPHLAISGRPPSKRAGTPQPHPSV